MTPGGLHLVPAKSRYLRFGITQSDLLDEPRCMYISRRFACYEEITFNGWMVSGE